MFAPIAKMNISRWELHQFDIKKCLIAWRFKGKVCLGYKQSQGDHTFFFKHPQGGKLIILLVYVDDIIVTREFERKDLGKLKYLLGIEVTYSKQGIFISQRKYVFDLLRETEKLGCKSIDVPVEKNYRISIEEKSAKYLIAMPRKILLFKIGGSLTMKTYTDADYASLVSDKRPTTNYCIFLCENLVTWRSKKQNVMARSSVDERFRAMAQGICELLSIQIVFDDLKIKYESLMKLFCDNK
ncbi:putative mitochondrial protein, partial [Mucuna pruriens]